MWNAVIATAKQESDRAIEIHERDPSRTFDPARPLREWPLSVPADRDKLKKGSRNRQGKQQKYDLLQRAIG